MKVIRAVVVGTACLLVAACYHQVVQTGRAPGSTVVSKPWTATWIFGLVPATPIDVSQQCPNGIATVETQMTVPNWLATAVTLGIYAPRDVKITCATRSALNNGWREIHVARGASPLDQQRVIEQAAELSAQTHAPVVLSF
ncbi:MAG TPA: hypothetical protein VJ867_08490 [Gemmatimonadaceae bacterium]|nr:hypothetical protein [Gemmatimonadaceae bacterium]